MNMSNRISPELLSFYSIMAGITMSAVSKILPRPETKEPPVPWRRIKQYKRANSEKNTSVGLFTDGTGEYIIKTLPWLVKTLEYRHFMHEAAILTALDGFTKKTGGFIVQFPSLLGMHKEQRATHMIMKRYAGNSLTEQTVLQPAVFFAILDCLETAYKEKRQLAQTIPARHPLILLCIFPYFFFMAIVHSRKSLRLLVPYLFRFFQAFRCALQSPYTIAHRDIHLDNILLSGKTVTILDPETCVAASRETDIALIARFYYRSWGMEKTIRFLSQRITTKQQLEAFFFFSVYYSTQTLSVPALKPIYYRQTVAFLTDLQKIIQTLAVHIIA